MRRTALLCCLLLAPLRADDALPRALENWDAEACRAAIIALSEQAPPFAPAIERALWELSAEEELGPGLAGAACALLSQRATRQTPVQERLLQALGDGSLRVERVEAQADGTLRGWGWSLAHPQQASPPPLPVRFVLKPGLDLVWILLEEAEPLDSYLDVICLRAPQLEECLLGVLSDALASPGDSDRTESILYKLHDWGPRARPAVPSLLARLRSADPDFPRQTAVDAWLAIGVDAAQAVPLCVEQLGTAWSEPEPFLELLAGLGPAGAAAAPAVLRWLPGYDPALRALTAMGSPAGPDLAELVPDSDEAVQDPFELAELFVTCRSAPGIAWLQQQWQADPDGWTVGPLLRLGPASGLSPGHIERWLDSGTMFELDELLAELIEAGWDHGWLTDLVAEKIVNFDATPLLIEQAVGLIPEAARLLPLLLADQEALFECELELACVELAGRLGNAGRPALPLLAGLLNLSPSRTQELWNGPTDGTSWWNLQRERIARLSASDIETRDAAFAALVAEGPCVFACVKLAQAEEADPQAVFLLEKLATVLRQQLEDPELCALAVDAFTAIVADDPQLPHDLWQLLFAEQHGSTVVRACEALRGLPLPDEIAGVLGEFPHMEATASTALARLLVDRHSAALLQQLQADPEAHALFLIEHAERLASRVGRASVLPLLAGLLDDDRPTRFGNATGYGETVARAAARALAILAAHGQGDLENPGPRELETIGAWWNSQGSLATYLPAAWLEIEQGGLEAGRLYGFSLWNAHGFVEPRQLALPGDRVVLGPFPAGSLRCFSDGQCFEVELRAGHCARLTLPDIRESGGMFFFD